jgi:hypothetical protein
LVRAFRFGKVEQQLSGRSNRLLGFDTQLQRIPKSPPLLKQLVAPHRRIGVQRERLLEVRDGHRPHSIAPSDLLVAPLAGLPFPDDQTR